MAAFDVVVVAVESPDGHIGLGEVARSPLLPAHALTDIVDAVITCDAERRPTSLVELQAQSAVRMAALDLAFRRRGVPLGDAWGVDREALAVTTTVGVMCRSERRATLGALVHDDPPSAVKVKVPTGPHDGVVAYLDSALDDVRRAFPSVAVVVDPNAMWSGELLTRALPVLWRHDVDLLEEPLAPNEGLAACAAAARRASGRPALAADERCVTRPLDDLAEAFGGINVKLGHVGGPLAARQLLADARALGLVTIVGCNGEGPLGTAGAWAAALGAHHVDLDSARMVAATPTTGARYVGNRLLAPPRRPGHGGGVDVDVLLSIANGRTAGAADVWATVAAHGDDSA
jgi:L-alanine-DL-glutamate epimerase-like enolase superfamily enzyme